MNCFFIIYFTTENYEFIINFANEGRVDEALASSQHLLYFWKNQETNLFEEPNAYTAQTGIIIIIIFFVFKSSFCTVQKYV